MEPRIQYCTTSDGVSLAYWTVGDGRPIIAMPVPGFSHAELSWQMFGAIQQPLAAKYRLISYDSRGSGLSDRGIIDFSIDAMLRDLEAAVERSGFDSFVLASWISAAPVALKYAATNPERVSHLILSDGWSKFSDIAESTAYKAGVPLLEADWVLFTETFAQVLWAYANPEFGRLFAQFIRMCISPEAMRAAWKAWESYDVTEFLPRVTAPTLVIHNKNSRWFAMEVGQRLAAAIPGARLTLIDAITYAPVPDLISEFIDAADKPSRSTGPASDSVFRTVLFTDLVGHTAMMSRLGDEKGREVLRDSERLSRDVLAAHGGTEVKTMGDGFMASFSSATKAVECAIALAASIRGPRGRAAERPRRHQRRGADRGGRRSVRRDGDPRIADRGEGGGRGNTGRGHRARAVLREGVLVRGPRGVRGEGLRGACAGV